MTLQGRIDRLQERCDALRGKSGYLCMLARLVDAKAASLANQSSTNKSVNFDENKESFNG